MRVRILKASKDAYWYADKIGEEFEVMPRYENDNKLLVDDGITYAPNCRYIDVQDCEEVPVVPAFPADKWKMRVLNSEQAFRVNATMEIATGHRQLSKDFRYDCVAHLYFNCGTTNRISYTSKNSEKYFVNKDAPEITFEQFCEHYGEPDPYAKQIRKDDILQAVQVAVEIKPPKEVTNAKMLLADISGIAEASKCVIKEQPHNAEPRTAPLSLAEANEVVRSGVDAMYWWK